MNEIEQLKVLAGVKPANSANWQPYNAENISMTGSEKGKYQAENNIKPGTDEWFKLWFARPTMTGESPISKD